MERLKMKKSTKPISSPGRTDKFPPPLMRFLRSKSSSSSRGRRSRASPMFFRKKNTVIETTQEPSSPKVTCIGQVRVRRCKKTTTTTTSAATISTAALHSSSNRLCRCLENLKPRSFHTVFRKWVSFFQCGCCERSSDSHGSPVIEPIPAAGKYGEEEEHEEDEHPTAETDNQVLISRSPPRNAFLLTRCRSAPYRSSSLASKFLESTMAKTGEEDVAEETKNLRIKEEDKEDEGVNEAIKNKNGGVNEGSFNGVDEELKATPLILTRCKSEPARTWDKLSMSLS